LAATEKSVITNMLGWSYSGQSCTVMPAKVKLVCANTMDGNANKTPKANIKNNLRMDTSKR